jgi:hypothetical protein
MEIGDRPWGMRDFRVIDPSGNRIGFGATPQKEPGCEPDREISTVSELPNNALHQTKRGGAPAAQAVIEARFANKALHQTRRGGVAASRPVVEARLAGERRCSALTQAPTNGLRWAS